MLNHRMLHMKKTVARLVSIAGTVVYGITGLIAVVYLFGAVVWMHAPPIAALLVTLVMMTPLLILSWILRRAGRPSPRQAWYRVRSDGKLVRSNARGD